MYAFWKNQSTGVEAATKRRGAMAVLAGLSLTVLFAMVAFAVDVGMIALTEARLQKNADAAALAAAQQLSGTLDPSTVRANACLAAQNVYIANVGGNAAHAYFDPNQDVLFGQSAWNSQSQTYTYNWGNQYTPYNVVQVFGRRIVRQPDPNYNYPLDQRLPLFFAPVLGQNSASIQTSAMASFMPRDIMLVLDFSHSMCYDSQFYRLGLLSQSQIETSLLNIWQDLGSPVYGNLQFTPSTLTFKGPAASGSNPYITVAWQGTSVSVTSGQTITKVRLKYSNNVAQTFSGSGKTGTFQGTGSSSGQEIVSCWVLSGGNANQSTGGYGLNFSFANTNVISALGLTNVHYPYPAGSWSEFVDYCTGGSADVVNAGYQYQFGAMLWVNYLQDIHGSYAETPDLWKTREMPTYILKQGVSSFINYLTSAQADDRVGLSIYSTGDSVGAILEQGLTTSISNVNTITQQRQAGHYDPYTNIGMGMQVARKEIEKNARPRAFRLMVVMTDGVVNRPTNATVGTNLVLSEAAAAAADNIKILTISMGVMADVDLMQQAANATNGINFVVPGGSDYATYQQQLLQTFETIAASRPLQLISGQ
jgi:Flp pilus assembly protein TadG